MATASGVRAGRAYIEIGGDESPLARALDRALDKLRAFGLSIAKIGISITGLGTLPIGTLLTLAKFSASAGSALQNLATQTGLSVTELSSLQSMAKLAGVDVAGVSGAFNNLNKEIVALNAGATASVAAFGRLGLQYKDLAGQSTFSQFVKVSDAISKLATPADRAAAALDVFGKSGAALLPIMAQGGKAIEDARRRFENLGVAIGANAASSVAAFDDALGEVVFQLAAIKNVIGAAAAEIFLPIARTIQPILAYTIRWADANRDLVGKILAVSAVAVTAGASLAVLGVGIAAASVAFGGLVSAAGVILSPVRLAASAVFSLASSLTSVAVGIGSLGVSSVTAVAGGFVSMAGAIVRVAAYVPQLLLIGPILSAATTAASLLGSVFLSLGTAIAATVPTVVAAVAGLAGSMVSAVVGTFVALYTPLLGFIAAIEIGISTALIGAVSAVVPAVGSLLLAITSQFGLLVPAVALIGAALAPVLIISLLGGADEVKAALAGFFEGIGDAITGTMRGVFASISTAFTSVAQVIGDVFTGIPGLLSRAFSGVQAIGVSAVEGLRNTMQSLADTGREVFASIADIGSRAWTFIAGRARELSGVIGAVYADALAAFQSGQLELAGEIVTVGIALAWEVLKGAVSSAWQSTVKYVLSSGVTLYTGLLRGFESAKSGIIGIFISIATGISRAWARAQAFILNANNNTFAAIEVQWINLQEQLGLITTQQANLQRAIINGAAAIRQKATEDQLLSSLNFTDIVGGVADAANKAALEAKIEEIKAYEEKLNEAIQNRDAGAASELERKLLERRKALAELQKQINKTGEGKPLFTVPDLAEVLDLSSKLKASVAFGAVNINQVLRGVDTNKVQDRTARATEQTAKNTATIVDKLDDALTIG